MEDRVTERQYTCTVTAAGAVVGAALSYLFFTAGGRTLRSQVMPALDELEHEFGRWRGAVDRTLRAAGESWQMFNEVRGQRSSRQRNQIPF
jgi:hypothetical protein